MQIANKRNQSRKKLLFVVNNLGFFVSHRLPIAHAALEKGYEVNVAYGELGDVLPHTLELCDLKTFFLPQQRGGTNPLQEIRSLYYMLRLFIAIRPDLIHLVTIKSYLYGGLIARLTAVKGVVSAVTGLGSLFVRQDFRSRILQALLFPFFRFAFGHPNQLIIVQNKDDARKLIHWGLVDSRKVRLLKGSGVSLAEFSALDEPVDIPTICFAARLLREKGVYDFVSAARILRKRCIEARFLLAGDLDPKNPSGLTELELRELREEGVVEVLGYKKNIAALYAHSHIVCLPSFYGEGLPKSLIEAAAASRVIVTTDHPGCRDVIIPNVSGLLVPIKSPEKLADALQWLIEHPQERIMMGKAGRQLAEREFTIEKIVQGHLDIYHELLGNLP